MCRVAFSFFGFRDSTKAVFMLTQSHFCKEIECYLILNKSRVSNRAGLCYHIWSFFALKELFPMIFAMFLAWVSITSVTSADHSGSLGAEEYSESRIVLKYTFIWIRLTVSKFVLIVPKIDLWILGLWILGNVMKAVDLSSEKCT